MHNPGIQFGMDGPVMSGTWTNPKTGHKFTVQDCFFEDGQFRVQTTAGQILDYNSIQDYIQTSNVESPIPTQKPSQSQEIPSEVQALIDGNDDLMIPEDHNPNLGNLNAPRRPQQTNYAQIVNTEEDADMVMIKRVLRKFPLPELEASINWPDVPVKQITTLIDVLGIEPSTIATYYINQLDRDAVFNYFIQALSRYIDKIGGIEMVAAATEESASTPAPESKKQKTKKKS